LFLQKVKLDSRITALIFGLFVVFQIYYNYSEVDRSGDYIFEDYTKACLKSVESNSMILSYQWDFLISEAYYFQYVEGYNDEAAIIDKELLRRSWYFNQIDNNYPKVLEGLENDVKEFKEALKPFERGGNYDAALLERLFRTILTELIAQNYQRKHIYIAPELVDKEMRSGQLMLPNNYSLVPHLFFYKVVPKNSGYVEAPLPDFEIRFGEKDNYYFNSIRNFTGRMLSSRALYELHFGKIDKAKAYVDKVKSELPSFKLPSRLQNLDKQF
jgi:hypothetical protein